MRRSLISLIFMVATLLGGAAAALAGSNELPDMGAPENVTLSRSDEYQIGLMIVRGLRDQGEVLEDPEVNDYIQSIGSRIAAQTPENGQSFQYFVVRDPSINAFALPGGFIGVNSGLITSTTNESQLASVLGHETAHVTQRHIARSIRAQGRQSLVSAAAILAAILIGATTGSADAAQAGIAVAQGTAMQQRINFTRANEYEADRVGIGFMAAAGFDPYAMPDFFATLGRRAGMAGETGASEFLQTHPVTSNRIAESRDRAAHIVRNVQPQSASYELVRERVRVITSTTDVDTRAYYRARAQNRALTPGEQYGAALADLANGQAEPAASALIELNAAHQGSPMIDAALGQSLMAAGRQDQAMAAFRKGLELSPRNVPLTVRYAEALLAAGNPKEAHAVLLDVFNVVAPTPDQIRLTALAASSAGDTGDAYYYMSEYHIASGDLPLATRQLELALAAPDLTSVQRERFAARLKEIREALAASGRRRNRDDAGKM
jgi:predicted Zn-dependent protease